MYFKNLAILAAVLSVSNALPTNETVVERRDSPGDRCGDSLFVDRTSGASPRIFDCAAIIYQLRISRPNEDIYVDLPEANGPINRLFTYGSCTFGVRRSYEGPGTKPAVVGTNDIADLIDDSIKKYGRDDKVGAEGAMVCTSGAGVWWGVFHS